MNKNDYQEYLKTDHWRKYRLSVLDLWNNECGVCTKVAKDVHHRHYENLGKEKLRDCIPLCRECHTKHHVTLKEIAKETYLNLTKLMYKVLEKRDALNDESGGCFEAGMVFHEQYCEIKEKRHLLLKKIEPLCTKKEYEAVWKYPYRV